LAAPGTVIVDVVVAAIPFVQQMMPIAAIKIDFFIKINAVLFSYKMRQTKYTYDVVVSKLSLLLFCVQISNDLSRGTACSKFRLFKQIL